MVFDVSHSFTVNGMDSILEVQEVSLEFMEQANGPQRS